jgi:hypothetical protein
MLRGERLIKNQTLMRELNEHVDAVERAFDASSARLSGATTHVFCECARRRCLERIELTQAEYAAVRRDPAAFLVRPGHEITSIERVVKHTSRYLVVVKFHPVTRQVAGRSCSLADRGCARTRRRWRCCGGRGNTARGRLQDVQVGMQGCSLAPDQRHERPKLRLGPAGSDSVQTIERLAKKRPRIGLLGFGAPIESAHLHND